MAGLDEQIKDEYKFVYDIKRFPIGMKQVLAGNILHLLLQTNAITLFEAAEIKPLIDSEDPESIELGVMVMETKAGQKFTT